MRYSEEKDSRKSVRRKFRATLAAAATATTMFVGGPVGCKPKVQTVPIEELAKSEEDIEMLGFCSEEGFNEYKRIKEELENSDISIEERLDIQDRLVNVMLSVIKEKVAICEYENVDSEGKSLLTGRDNGEKRAHDEMKVLMMPGNNSNPPHAKIVLSNPDSIYFDRDGVGFDDFVFFSKCMHTEYSIDERIEHFIFEMGGLIGKVNPSIEELRSALEKLEEFTLYEIDFKDGELVANNDRVLQQKIDEILSGNER